MFISVVTGDSLAPYSQLVTWLVQALRVDQHYLTCSKLALIPPHTNPMSAQIEPNADNDTPIRPKATKLGIRIPRARGCRKPASPSRPPTHSHVPASAQIVCVKWEGMLGVRVFCFYFCPYFCPRHCLLKRYTRSSCARCSLLLILFLGKID